jgi:hypothetical protein
VSDILKGAREATEHAKVTRAVYDWIRDDVGMAAKMTITPDICAKLVDRICGSTTHLKEPHRD